MRVVAVAYQSEVDLSVGVVAAVRTGIRFQVSVIRDQKNSEEAMSEKVKARARAKAGVED